MRHPTLAALALACAGMSATGSASASCYTVYDRVGTVLFRSSLPPVDLSRRLGDTVPARFGAGARLVFIPVFDWSSCLPIEPPGDRWNGNANAAASQATLDRLAATSPSAYNEDVDYTGGGRVYDPPAPAASAAAPATRHIYRAPATRAR